MTDVVKTGIGTGLRAESELPTVWRLSDLIHALTEAQSRFGDLPVYARDFDINVTYAFVHYPTFQVDANNNDVFALHCEEMDGTIHVAFWGA